MNKFILGIIFILMTNVASAELKFTSELLVGQTKNTYYTFSQVGNSQEDALSSLNSDSIGFRVGLKITEHFNVELAKHNYGSTISYLDIKIPIMFHDGTVSPSHYEIATAINKVSASSINIGIKGSLELNNHLSFNSRFGIALWEYDKSTPQVFTPLGYTEYEYNKSGGDFYYSFGAQYNLTDNLYVGTEYSLLFIKEKFKNQQSDITGDYEHFIKNLSLIVGWNF